MSTTATEPPATTPAKKRKGAGRKPGRPYRRLTDEVLGVRKDTLDKKLHVLVARRTRSRTGSKRTSRRSRRAPRRARRPDSAGREAGARGRASCSEGALECNFSAMSALLNHV